jgi:hypothetical protein
MIRLSKKVITKQTLEINTMKFLRKKDRNINFNNKIESNVHVVDGHHKPKFNKEPP